MKDVKMKKFIISVVLIWLAVKLLLLVNVDEIILDFLVLGIIPGTNFALNLFMVAILGLVCLWYLWRWGKRVNEQLVAFKLKAAQKEEIKAKTVTKSAKNIKEPASTVEIEELKIANT